MSKISRTPTRATGGITAAEKAQLDSVADFWIANAMRTDSADINKLAPAIHGIYKAAGLKKPRVVLVSSPIAMVAAYGAAAAIWYNRKRSAATSAATREAAHEATYEAIYAATSAATSAATRAATDEATSAATREAIYAATSAATREATHEATREAIYAATSAATREATREATYTATDETTREATREAIYAATYTATYTATSAAIYAATSAATETIGNDYITACRQIAGDFGVECAKNWYKVYQGGNMWSYYDSFLAGARDVLGLRLPEHDQYQHWEQAALNGGFRVMHEQFCIVSDFPEILRVDENNLPHAETGPSHRWRDGWELYHWHGVRVPKHWITDRESVRPAEILSESNVELRAAGISIIGMARMLDMLPHTVIDSDPDPVHGDLIRVELPGFEEPLYYLSAHCPRNGRIMEAVNPAELDELTVRGAQAWRIGIPAAEFIYPETRT